MAKITQKQMIENRRTVIEYLQKPGLRKAKGHLRKGAGRCCLGHMCDALGVKGEKVDKDWYYDDQTSWMPQSVMDMLGMTYNDGGSYSSERVYGSGEVMYNSLSTLNDESDWGPKKIGQMLAGMLGGGDRTPWAKIRVRK